MKFTTSQKGAPVDQIFFSNLHSLIRTCLIGILIYIILLIFLRLAGKRTLSKMNAFDLVVTVSLGSSLATTLLDKSITLADGALAFLMLIGLQFIISWTSVRISWFRKMITGEPEMLLFRGSFLPAPMKRTRVTENEILAAVREAGLADLAQVEAVVLETDGELSVIKQFTGDNNSSLSDVRSPF